MRTFLKRRGVVHRHEHEEEDGTDDECAYDVVMEKYGYDQGKQQDNEEDDVVVVNGIVNMTENVKCLRVLRGRKMYNYMELCSKEGGPVLKSNL